MIAKIAKDQGGAGIYACVRPHRVATLVAAVVVWHSRPLCAHGHITK
jgi:hypothetical protein